MRIFLSALLAIAARAGGTPRPTNYRKVTSLKDAGYSTDLLLGSGSVSVVYAGMRASDNSSCAVRIISKDKLQASADDDFSPDAMTATLAIWSSLDQSGIVPILDALEDNSNFYQIEPLLSGDILSRFRPVKAFGVTAAILDQPTEDQFVFIIHPLLATLNYLHNNASIVHGSLAPAAALFSNSSGSATPVVIDLDMMLRVGPTELLFRRAGKPLMMSPEILAGRGYQGPPADVWAVGVMAYILAYGEYPFPTDADARAGRPSYSSREGWQPSDGCRSFIQRMLEFEPEARLTAAHAMHPSSWVSQKFAQLMTPDTSTTTTASPTTEMGEISDKSINAITDDEVVPSSGGIRATAWYSFLLGLFSIYSLA